MINKKRVLIAHYNGSWFDEPSKIGYEDQIKWVTALLQQENVEVTRIEAIPSDEEVMEFDGIIFFSLSFKREAGGIRKRTGKKVFVVTGLPERGDDQLGFVPISKSIGWHEVAGIISKCLHASSKILIRTEVHGVANRADTNWHSLEGDRLESAVEDFLKEKAGLEYVLERGGIVSINCIKGLLTKEIRYI